jgi:class I fructose-bisphosphate aldolase
MKQVSLKEITRDGKAFFLAYDQGMEHGPVEFTDENVDPLRIIEIAKTGKYTGVIFQKGIAEKYNSEIKKSKVPLIVKLNGKTNLLKGEPYSTQICSVKEAIKLGAKAVGYTIYIGSDKEAVMLKEFDKIEEEAHEKGLPVIAWIYPGGKAIEGKPENEIMAYAARLGLEIGADIIKLKFRGTSEDLKWAVKTAGRTKIIVSGGEKTEEKKFVEMIKEVIRCGADGVAVGRNIWKSNEPEELSSKVRRIVLAK